MYRSLFLVLIMLGGCVTVIPPASQDTHHTEVIVELIQPIEWEVDIKIPPITTTPTVNTTGVNGCRLPTSPDGGVLPLLQMPIDEGQLTPYQIEEAMANYIDELHMYIERYQRNVRQYIIDVERVCSGEVTH